MDQSKPTPRTKLTDHERDLIQELLEGGMTLREIAERFAKAPAA